MRKTGIVFVDFDSVVLSKKTPIRFLAYAAGKRRLWLARNLFRPLMWLQALHLIKYKSLHERVFHYLYKQKECTLLEEKARSFSLEVLPRIIDKHTHQKIRWHIERHHEVVMISSGLSLWITPWARTKGVSVIATEVVCKEGILSGEFDPCECRGSERIRRIHQMYDLDDFDSVFIYTRHRDDRELLALSQDKQPVDFF